MSISTFKKGFPMKKFLILTVVSLLFSSSAFCEEEDIDIHKQNLDYIVITLNAEDKILEEFRHQLRILTLLNTPPKGKKRDESAQAYIDRLNSDIKQKEGHVQYLQHEREKILAILSGQSLPYEGSI